MRVRAAAVVNPAERGYDRLAGEVADAWIDSWVRDLAHDGRVMSGGWPGTLSEARERVCLVLGGDHGLDREALDRLTKLTYATARARWRARAGRESGD
jgi:hypothetical protein